MKYQSAFGVLQASTNLTKERLLETADHYLNVLDNEEKDFEASKKSKIASDVTSRMNNVSEKEKMIAKEFINSTRGLGQNLKINGILEISVAK